MNIGVIIDGAKVNIVSIMCTIRCLILCCVSIR